tara:strand:- start:175 stop:375 length:201 start_codon:yes stop_codon:yes gene_type:complete
MDDNNILSVGGGVIGILILTKSETDLSSKGIHIPMKMGFFVPIYDSYGINYLLLSDYGFLNELQSN